jgi:hypothetical protein
VFSKRSRTFSELAQVPEIERQVRVKDPFVPPASEELTSSLNQVNLSLEEYRWIRDQSYKALGIPYVDFDIGKIADGIRSGQTTNDAGQLRGSVGPSGPESNRKLVEGHRKQLESNVAMASFGL